MSTPAFPSEFLTSREVAELLRVRPRKIYDLAARGAIPCRRVTGKLLFPRAEINAWLARGSLDQSAIDTAVESPAGGAAILPVSHHHDAAQAGVTQPGIAQSGTLQTRAAEAGAARNSAVQNVAVQTSAGAKTLPGVIAGSHDPLLEWAIRESGCMLAMRFDGSLAGLADLEQGLALGAGLHVFDRVSEQWNTPRVQHAPAASDCVLVEWAWRQQGLILALGQEQQITSVDDLAGCRVVRRQPESGARLLLEDLLAEAGVRPDTIDWVEPCARTEADAATMVAAGKAAVAPGLACMAARFSLGFVPTRLERFDLLLKRREYFAPGTQKLLAFARSPQFREMADELGGYDVTGIGRVIWNAG